ncbi:single-stranded DNA-binding protein [Floricoccus tropicus]|uniref:Single-stranded DNA-binding protein n=1 Tax=Floricoccus tropicus TaxID=1859473 RepID=A0A1E8GJR2_9LACT|nr:MULTISPECIES: single-stranded DNA-binding protein [Floricoccus]OFI48176.1 single-stranded DNA-binding protein [Floricoccus tropicus]URZ87069.1 single-stranded DNA-binding protein [Floricoccus penangensis]
MNKTMLIGRLTDTPELKKTPTDKNFTRFIVAVNRKFKNSEGEKEADFISVIAWGKLAELLSSYGKKGALLSLEGEVRTSSYTDKQDQKRYQTEILCTAFELLESRAAQALRENNYDTTDLILEEEEMPF